MAAATVARGDTREPSGGKAGSVQFLDLGGPAQVSLNPVSCVKKTLLTLSRPPSYPLKQQLQVSLAIHAQMTQFHAQMTQFQYEGGS